MKKIIFQIITILFVISHSPNSSGIPSFSRQVGRECMSCHTQHFPVLNSYGRLFKTSGYTLMGSQTKIEGENFSIPSALNASMLLKARYVKNGAAVAPAGTSSTGDGQFQIPDELSLFLGGKVAKDVGFFFEGNTMSTTGFGAGFKMPMKFDATDDIKVLGIPFFTDVLGASYGFELSSTGANRAVRWAEHSKDISAQQYVGTDGAAAGFALVAVHSMGYINVSKWSPVSRLAPNSTTGNTNNPSSDYMRIAATPTFGNWDMLIGAQLWGGGNSAIAMTRAQAADIQANGEVGGKELSIYSTWAQVANENTTATTSWAATAKTKAFTLGADYSIIPHLLHLGAAYRNANTATDLTDNSVTGMLVYDKNQNVAFHLNHSERTGTKYTGNGGEKETTLMLEAAW